MDGPSAFESSPTSKLRPFEFLLASWELLFSKTLAFYGSTDVEENWPSVPSTKRYAKLSYLCQCKGKPEKIEMVSAEV